MESVRESWLDLLGSVCGSGFLEPSLLETRHMPQCLSQHQVRPTFSWHLADQSLLLGILIILGVSLLSKLGSVGQPLSELCPFLCIDLVYRTVLVP